MPHLHDAHLVFTDHGLVLLVHHNPHTHTLQLSLHLDLPEPTPITAACPDDHAHNLAELLDAGHPGTLHAAATVIRTHPEHLTLETPTQHAQFLLTARDRARLATAVRLVLPERTAACPSTTPPPRLSA